MNRPTAASTKYIELPRGAGVSDDLERLPRAEAQRACRTSRVPAWPRCWYSTTSAACLTGEPLTASSTSPRSMPAAAAAEPGGDFDRGHAFGARAPQHAVLDLVPARVHRDVRDAERDEHRHDGDRERRSAPRRASGPRRFGAIQSESAIGRVRSTDRHFADRSR